MHSDPIADMLTRIRNASMAKLNKASMPYSKIKEQIASVLEQNKYIEGVKIYEEDNRKILEIALFPEKSLELKRISKPGQRIYKKAKELYPTRKGYGLTIITTSEGVMTEKDALQKKLGGEVICEIF